jgi:hypothetical protein
MNLNDLDSLAQTDVPPVPERLEEDVHHRVNRALLLEHVGEFALKTAPFCLLEFTRALLGAAPMMASGKDPVASVRRKNPRR